MANMSFDHRTEFSSMVFKAFSTVVRKQNIQRGFTNGVEIYYTDPTPIDNHNKYGSYTLILMIDRKREVTHVDMMMGNRADILSKVQGMQQQRPQSSLIKINSIDITNEVKNQLAANQASVAGNQVLSILYNQITTILNNASHGYGQYDVLQALSTILYQDLEVIGQNITQLVYSLYEDMNTVVEFLNFGQTSIPEAGIVLDKGVFSSVTGFEYKATPYFVDITREIKWYIDVQPGYTLMRSVKDDMAFTSMQPTTQTSVVNHNWSTNANAFEHAIGNPIKW